MSGSRLVAWSALVAALIALAYWSRAVGGVPPRDVLYRFSTVVAEAVTYAVLLAFVLAISCASPDVLALRRPTSWRLALGLGIVVYVGVLVVSRVTDPFLHPGREQGLTPSGWDPHRAAAYVANGVVIVFLAPFVEELLFRGLGFTLLAGFGDRIAILTTGVLFGLYHGLIDALPVLVAFGLGLAWIRSRTRSAVPGMVVHAFFNALALALAVAT